MNDAFWARMHGGTTHFPFVLLLVSVGFDLAGCWWRSGIRAREFSSVGFYSLLLAAAVSPFAVLSGIALSKGTLIGSGALARHHLFLWPTFGLVIGLAGWRSVVRTRVSRRAQGYYLALAGAAAVGMLGAGYWGGEMILAH